MHIPGLAMNLFAPTGQSSQLEYAACVYEEHVHLSRRMTTSLHQYRREKRPSHSMAQTTSMSPFGHHPFIEPIVLALTRNHTKISKYSQEITILSISPLDTLHHNLFKPLLALFAAAPVPLLTPPPVVCCTAFTFVSPPLAALIPPSISVDPGI